MNRIVLIGNGFDLAHGMKTSYNDFLEGVWREVHEKFINTKPIDSFEQNGVRVDKTYIYGRVSNSWVDFETFEEELREAQASIKIVNGFLRDIFTKQRLHNWVDIENEYYKMLKFYHRKGSDVRDLNQEFKEVEGYLINYLKEAQKEILTPSFIPKKEIIGLIYEEFDIRHFKENYKQLYMEDLYEEYSALITRYKVNKNELRVLDDKIRCDHLINYFESNNINFKKQLLEGEEKVPLKVNPKSVCLLNFNYTNLTSKYLNKKRGIESEEIQIHGALNPFADNPVIFGYGDELDKDYKDLEEANKDDLLENIKSIKYHNRNNYKKLLEYINSDYFQIYIFGHSCGSSDRTLLNTLFEHENCVSIKPFYYQKSDNVDNYSKIIKNISRNFNDKALMRDIVVNKQYCKPLVS